jgi:hypothetical protein
VTIAPHTTPFTVGRPDRGTLQITWSAVHPRKDASARPQPVRFVASVRTIGTGRAILDAWLEGARSVRPVVNREPVTCEVVRDGELVHLDVRGGDEKLLTISLDDGADEPQLLYARTPLLAAAGLRPGGYDPPSAVMVADRRGAASA